MFQMLQCFYSDANVAVFSKNVASVAKNFERKMLQMLLSFSNVAEMLIKKKRCKFARFPKT